MTRVPARPAYAVVSKRTGKIGIQALNGALAIFRERRPAELDCTRWQVVRRVRIGGV